MPDRDRVPTPRGITPTYVAGFRAFLDLNRCVRKGEKAIRILAPVTVKQRDEHGEETGEKQVFFRTVPVFDVSMTDPLPGKEPVPLSPPSQPITGDSHHHLIAPLIAHAAELGYTRRDPRPPRGRPGRLVRPQAPRRSSSPPDPPTGRSARSCTSSRTPTGSATQHYGRERCEVLVDCVTYSSARLGRPRRRRRVDPLHRRLGRRRRARRHPRVRRRRSTRSRAASRTRSTRATRAGDRHAAAADAHRGMSARSVGAARAPMIGQARPAGRRRDAHAGNAAGRSHPGRGSCSPRPNQSARQRPPQSGDARRRGRALPPPPPRPAPRRRPRRQRPARAHRGRLPERLGDPAPRQPERTSIFGWLYVVATREAFRLCERDRRHVHLETMLAREGSWDAVIADAVSIDDDHRSTRSALRDPRDLPERQRADLTLRSPASATPRSPRLTGGRTYTNVNKHIAKARARVRLARLSDNALSAPRQGVIESRGQESPRWLFMSRDADLATRTRGRPSHVGADPARHPFAGRASRPRQLAAASRVERRLGGTRILLLDLLVEVDDVILGGTG